VQVYLIVVFLPVTEGNYTKGELILLRAFTIASLYQQERNIQILRKQNQSTTSYPDPLKKRTSKILKNLFNLHPKKTLPSPLKKRKTNNPKP
jgi:hypothetical protein